VCAALICALLAASVPAGAADRSSIARIPKPSAAGEPWAPAERAALRASLDALFADASPLREAHSGFIALETSSGAVLYERNSHEHFLPASTAKLVTGSVALAQLGPAFRFTTELRATGPIEAGELQGDLVLHGGGDPLLAAADLEDAASAVASAGVRRIAGSVRADSSYFEAKRYGDGWSVDDIPYDYMPVLSALSLEENAVHLKIAPGANAGDPASVHAEPASVASVESANASAAAAAGCPAGDLPFRLVNRATTAARGAPDTVDVTREPCATIALVGAIPSGAGADEIDAAVPNPEAYAAAVFRAALTARGIAAGSPAGAVAGASVSSAAPAVSGTSAAPAVAVAAAGSVLWTHSSEPLSELLADFWYPSDNLIGEALLRALGVARSGPPGTDAAGLALVGEELAALGIPAGALAGELQADWNAPYRNLVLDALPVAGVRGTLAHVFSGTPLERRVFAKSGSMSHVSALAGYLATQRHGAVTFAFLVDDRLGASAPLEELRMRILSRLATD
jgi:D-alanyl-D-alanine carboxypeptidase/D-alanyl-D-alanine-endopeptidase (penicillin-binding protein 4)